MTKRTKSSAIRVKGPRVGWRAAARRQETSRVKVIRDLRRTELEFLTTDLALADSFLDRAASAKDQATITRNLNHAETVYHSLKRLAGKLKLDAKQAAAMGSRLAAVRARLRQAPEVPSIQSQDTSPAPQPPG